MGKPLMYDKKVRDTSYLLIGDVEHGECFYDEEMFEDYIKRIDKLKEYSIELFKENMKELESENE